MDRNFDETFDEDDSLFSVSGPSNNPRPLYSTPPAPAGHGSRYAQHLTPPGPGVFISGRYPPVLSSPIVEGDSSMAYYPNTSGLQPGIDRSWARNHGSTGQDEEDEDEEEPSTAMTGIAAAGDETFDEEEAGDDEAGSDGSSEQYDPEGDPETFAKRLDELAGVLERGEVEAGELKWGPVITRGAGKMSKTSNSDLKAVINHHLSTTAWQYSSSALTPFPDPNHFDTFDSLTAHVDFVGAHPIRVLGQNWSDRDVLFEMGLLGLDAGGGGSSAPERSP
ncbi:hypothetical protein L198_04177 [Cryptococcus wingfieldii CBS 7118]|uniref:Uncharacterized protein n=1 Tax=Cryptococcus wingfieldii CBS 7118 TaxID=1295528 RepID=A0A1E3J6H0_9TREE|nr:hypothetical protein L198_04177 [Cryptococcus wingfieldii CBS 7118]ODN96463.1 hypothetical protein L198_04177 [Cryptococcus wingfieldii CBS 7118]